MNVRQLYILALLLGSSLFTACGGGGGGGGSSTPPPPAPVALTSTNAQYVADATLDAVNSYATSSGITLPSAAVVQSGSTSGLMDMTRVVLHFAHNSAQFGQGAIEPGVCLNEPTGYADVTPSGSNGGSVLFSNCLIDGIYLNGGASVYVITDNATTFSATMSFNNLSATDNMGAVVTLNGTISLVDENNTETVSGSYLSVSITSAMSSDVVSMFNFNIQSSIVGATESTKINSLTVSTSKSSGSVTVTTSTTQGGATIVQNLSDPYPNAGSLVLIGANNTRVRVTAMGDGSPSGMVRIEYDIDGVVGYETFEDLTWAELDAVGNN